MAPPLPLAVLLKKLLFSIFILLDYTIPNAPPCYAKFVVKLEFSITKLWELYATIAPPYSAEF